MQCIVCKNGTTKEGHVTVSVDRDSTVVVVRNVPASICTTCGEEYLDAEILKEVEIIVERARKDGLELAVHQFKAA